MYVCVLLQTMKCIIKRQSKKNELNVFFMHSSTLLSISNKMCTCGKMWLYAEMIIAIKLKLPTH